jgi:hypothetical protein
VGVPGRLPGPVSLQAVDASNEEDPLRASQLFGAAEAARKQGRDVDDAAAAHAGC